MAPKVVLRAELQRLFGVHPPENASHECLTMLLRKLRKANKRKVEPGITKAVTPEIPRTPVVSCALFTPRAETPRTPSTPACQQYGTALSPSATMCTPLGGRWGIPPPSFGAAAFIVAAVVPTKEEQSVLPQQPEVVSVALTPTSTRWMESLPPIEDVGATPRSYHHQILGDVVSDDDGSGSVTTDSKCIHYAQPLSRTKSVVRRL